MSEIQVNITVKAVDNPISDPPEHHQYPSLEELRCWLFATCANPNCYEFGCQELVKQNTKTTSEEDKS